MAARSEAERRAIAALVREAQQHLDGNDLAAAQACVAEACALDGDDADVLWTSGEIRWAAEDLAGARTDLARAVEVAPRHADARWALARVLEALDERQAMTAHDLVVRRLDAAADRRQGLGRRADLDLIEAMAVEVLEGLPEAFSLRLDDIPVVLEARPSEDVVAEGFDPRALGLFEGPDDLARGASDLLSPRPTRIVLYYANLLAVCPDDDTLREQVEVTILHEIGHYFGLDEAQVEALGLG